MNTLLSSGTIKRSSLPKNVEESRIIPFILSTWARDRNGTVMNPNKWSLDNFKRNPIVGYMHHDGKSLIGGTNPDYVIGHAVDTHVEGTGKSAQLVDKLKFDPPEVNILAERLFRKCLFGTINAASVMFLERGSGRWGVGDEAKGQVNETYYLAGQELLEWSLVNIPSNPYALKREYQSVSVAGMGGIMYCLHELGYHYTFSQVKELRIKDVLALLEAKDLGVKTKDTERALKLVSDPAAQKELNERIEQQQKEFKEKLDRINQLTARLNS